LQDDSAYHGHSGVNLAVSPLRFGEGQGEGLKGKIFVLTGTLENMTRSQAKALIEKSGGKVTESVSKNTSFVVAGASPGSKLDKAKKLGIPIIDETTFKKMCEV